MFIQDTDLDFLPILDPGSRGQKGTGSGVPIRNTGFHNNCYFVPCLRYLNAGILQVFTCTYYLLKKKKNSKFFMLSDPDLEFRSDPGRQKLSHVKGKKEEIHV